MEAIDQDSGVSIIFARRMQPNIIDLNFDGAGYGLFALLFKPTAGLADTPGGFEMKFARISRSQAYERNGNLFWIQIFSELSRMREVYIAVAPQFGDGTLGPLSNEVKVEQDPENYDFSPGVFKTVFIN